MKLCMSLNIMNISLISLNLARHARHSAFAPFECYTSSISMHTCDMISSVVLVQWDPCADKVFLLLPTWQGRISIPRHRFSDSCLSFVMFVVFGATFTDCVTPWQSWCMYVHVNMNRSIPSILPGLASLRRLLRNFVLRLSEFDQKSCWPCKASRCGKGIDRWDWIYE